MKNNGRPAMQEHEEIHVPEQYLLSDTIRLAKERLVKSLKQAAFLNKPVSIGPESTVSTLDILQALAFRVERLEGVKHEEIPEPQLPPEPTEEAETSRIICPK